METGSNLQSNREATHEASREANSKYAEPAEPRPPVSSDNHLETLVEALLFVADGSTAVDDLARALNVEPEVIRSALDKLGTSLDGRGLRLQRLNNRVQLVTATEVAPHIERFLGLDISTKLSPAALETLAIVAYRQPVTRAQVEAIRGVGSGAVLRTLVARDLVAQIGRLDQAGRPILYGTTSEFLQYFGLPGLKDLPPLKEDDTTG